MVRITQLHDDGTEQATIELDDFTVEILYSGIASMLRDATTSPRVQAPVELNKDARSRRERILNRING